jgi:endonuclease-8
MPEGDSLRRAAECVRVLEGETLAVTSPHPRAAVLGVAPALDGRRLERVEAIGKNLLLTFEGGLVLRSHLRMKGRWRVFPADAEVRGLPWLVLRGARHQAVLTHGPVLELGGTASLRRLGPDVMDEPPDVDGMLRRFRAADQRRELGSALLDQRLVAGIGNMWKAEALWHACVSPWQRLGQLDDADLRRVLETAARLMREQRATRAAYRRAGRPCPRCGAPIRSRAQGDTARTAYWCEGCQAGTAGESS